MAMKLDHSALLKAGFSLSVEFTKKPLKKRAIPNSPATGKLKPSTLTWTGIRNP
ncbi:hypothetical protein LEMLEM_LOCUS661 [Lemmus lemmus]